MCVTCVRGFCLLTRGKDADSIDFEHLLRLVIQRHTKALLTSYRNQLQHGSTRVFSSPGAVTFIHDGECGV